MRLPSLITEVPKLVKSHIIQALKEIIPNVKEEKGSTIQDLKIPITNEKPKSQSHSQTNHSMEVEGLSEAMNIKVNANNIISIKSKVVTSPKPTETMKGIMKNIQGERSPVIKIDYPKSFIISQQISDVIENNRIGEVELIAVTKLLIQTIILQDGH